MRAKTVISFTKYQRTKNVNEENIMEK